MIELVDPDLPRVEITLEAPGDTDGVTELALDSGGGSVREPGRDLELVEARAGGAILDVERLEPWRWRLTHAPDARITAVFALEDTAHRADPDPRVHYLPIVEPGFLHVIGSHALAAPEHLDGGEERPLRLEWRGFAEAGWRTLTSFGIDGGPREVRSSLDGFRHALFLAGRMQVLERSVRGAPVCVSVYGDAWATPVADFADLCASIVETEREFFGELDRPFYLISLIPVGTREPGVVSMGGTGLTNSFALFLLPGASLVAEEGPGMSIPWLLAHEMFHEWNGHAVTLAQPERLGYWFSEGFSDFYARRLLLRAGLLTLEGYADSWNTRFAEFATNPERNAPAERIAEAFWTDRNVGDLPYQRGDLVALLIDHAIRTRTNGEQSLDDLMRDLVRRSRAGQREFTVDELLAAIGEFAGEPAAAHVREVVVDGVDPELPSDVGAPELELVRTEIPSFEVGFDHDKTVAEGVVASVREDSAAAHAGLRDGMQALGWSVSFGRTDLTIEIQVCEGEGVRKISYLPVGEAVPAYRFQVRQPCQVRQP